MKSLFKFISFCFLFFLSIQNVFGYKIYEDKSSTQLAIEYLEKNNVIQGWNNDKKFYIALATSYADLNNSKNKNFIKLRTLKSFEASLVAKTEIISFIKTEISAKDNTKTQVNENNENSYGTKINASVIKSFASMPLAGALQIAHFESIISNRYEVTSIFMWSKKHEKRVNSLLNNENFKLKPNDSTLKEYLSRTDWSSVIGSRKFIDEKGNFYIFGVGVTDLKNKKAIFLSKSKKKSEEIAKKEIGIALKGGVAIQRFSKEILKETDDGNSVKYETSSNFSEKLYQGLDSLNLRNASRHLGLELKHPLTGQDMYVSVFSVSSGRADNVTSVEEEQKKNIQKVNSSSTKVITLIVDVEGVGRTFKEAIKDGLLQAISQVNGTQISSETKSMINTFESSQNDSDQSLGTESFQEKIKQKTNGVIQKWNIISKTKSDNGSFNKVNLKVYISKLKLSDDLKKMRLVITTPKINPLIKQNKKTYKFGQNFYNEFSNLITKSQKFAVLDRNNSNEINKELEKIKFGNVPTDELAKLGNTVTADYIVVSKINNLTSRVNKEKLLGETVKINSVKADLLINIINVPTSQIIYSDRFKLEQVNSNTEKLASIISKRLSRKVIDTFYPAKLISINNKEITVDQGRDFFDKNTKYKIIMLGKRIVDETTGTISGRVEKEIGLSNYISGSVRQSKLKIYKLNTNSSNLKADGSIIIRPIFAKLPSIDQVLKNRIKNIKNKNTNLKKKIQKDKDW